MSFIDEAARSTRAPTASGEGVEPLARPRQGAILRGVVLRHEPRTLARPSLSARSPSSPGSTPRGSPREPDGGVPPGDLEHAPPAKGGGATPYRLEDSASYQQGLRAGLAAAEADLARARDEAVERGYREGLDRGLAEGREDGLARGREEAAREAAAARESTHDRMVRLDRLIASLPAAIADRLASAEVDMVALCHQVVCRVLGERLVTREGVAAGVREAIREASGDRALRGEEGSRTAVHVHPADLRSLQGDEELATWLRDGPAQASGGIRWVADERVHLGGCIVVSPGGSLDARIETQLSSLRDLLLRTRAPGSPVRSGPTATSPSAREGEP